MRSSYIPDPRPPTLCTAVDLQSALGTMGFGHGGDASMRHLRNKTCAGDAMYRSLCCVSRVGAREIANATCCGWGGPPSAVNSSELYRIWKLGRRPSQWSLPSGGPHRLT